MRTRTLVPLALLVALLLPLPAWSQETPAVAPAAPAQPEVVIKDDGAHPAATKGKDASGADTLSVDFPDEDIRNILRNVADLFELNLVIPDTLQGRTSIKLRDVTWRQIFKVVLSPVNYTYIEDGNIIKIVSNESLQQEPLMTEVFMINYAPAAELSPALAPLVNSAGASIKVDTRSNALIITERASQMVRIRPVIERLDRATAQVMIESKFVEVTNSDVKNIGVNWASLNEYQLTGKVDRKYDNTDGRQLSQDRSEKNIDVPFMQNGYERADDVAGRNNGTGGTNPNPKTGIGPPYTVDDKTGALSYDDIGPASEISQIFSGDLARTTSAVLTAPQFNVILSALKTLSDTKLVSNPTVVTLNNTEAQINIGREFPIPRYTYNQERGTYEVSGFEYRPIGVILKVTPQVNSQGFIKLTVEPEVSSSNEYAQFGDAQIPIVTTRKTKTQVSLKDGFTMGIGGLVTNDITTGQTKVPVLGSIPIIGRLFRSDSKSDESRNLVIFLTAKTVSADGATVEEVFDSRRVREMKLRRDELPGYRDGSDPFLPPVSEEEAKKEKKN